MNKKFYGFAFGALTLSMLTACSNDVKNDEPNPDNGPLPKIEIAKAPVMSISSNGNVLGGDATVAATRATDKYDRQEVEVNLAIQDVHYLKNAAGQLIDAEGNPLGEDDAAVAKYTVEDFISHLSIHVRTATDVEVTIPLPAKFYLDQDDLFIYSSRNEIFEFTKVEHSLTARFGGKEVSITVDFGNASKENDGTITITTSGITQDVIDYCKENYSDGISFDVYNYYLGGAWSLTGELSQQLNNSTIKFVEVEEEEGTGLDAVEYYINAFTGTFVNEDDFTSNVLRDCEVSIVEGQKTSFDEVDNEEEYGDNLVFVKKAPIQEVD